MAEKRSRRILVIGKLGRRLIGAFVGVAVAAVVAVIAIDSVTIAPDVMQFVQQQQMSLTSVGAQAARIAYLGHGVWDKARLMPIMDIVRAQDAAARVTDASGRPVIVSARFASMPPGPQFSEPVIVSGRRVGTVTFRFDHSGLASAAARFESERWHSHIYAAAIAVALALVVSAAAARRITLPLERVLAAIRARGAGDRSARIGDIRAVGVLRELIESFNAAAESLDRQERAQRDLIASVAHELRTPVAVLQAGHEAMLDGITLPTPENLTSLRDEVLRLGRTLEDLRALAAAESAALQLRLVLHDLADIAADAAASLGSMSEISGVTVTTDLAPAPVLCDYDRMREVTTNLLMNAINYTPSGGRVYVETGSDQRGHAVLTVSDTGVGIAPGELERVTERFFRGERTTHMANGTGLGLAIVAELVRAHHGNLSITIEPDIGTHVRVTFPIAAVLQPPAAGHQRAISRRASATSLRICATSSSAEANLSVSRSLLAKSTAT